MDKEPVYTTDYSSLLEGVMIAAPCNVGWENMKGDDRVRFCGQCQLNVYNTSVMTPREIEKLLSGEGQLPCLRLYRRADGTLLTENCPVGLRKIRAGYRKLARFATAFWTLIASISSAWAQAGDSVKMGETGSIEARKKDAVHAKTHPGDAISAQMNDGFSSKADLLASREFQMACLAKQRAKKAEAELHFKKAIVALDSGLHDTKFVETVYTEYASFLREHRLDAQSELFLSRLDQKLKKMKDDALPSRRDTTLLYITDGVPYQTSPTEVLDSAIGPVRRQRVTPTLPCGAPIPDNE